MLKGVCISLRERYDPALFHRNCISSSARCSKEVLTGYNLKLKISFWKIFLQLAITDNKTSAAETQSVYEFLFSVKYLFSIFCKFPFKFHFTKYLFSIFVNFPVNICLQSICFLFFVNFRVNVKSLVQACPPSLPARLH